MPPGRTTDSRLLGDTLFRRIQRSERNILPESFRMHKGKDSASGSMTTEGLHSFLPYHTDFAGRGLPYPETNPPYPGPMLAFTPHHPLSFQTHANVLEYYAQPSSGMLQGAGESSAPHRKSVKSKSSACDAKVAGNQSEEAKPKARQQTHLKDKHQRVSKPHSGTKRNWDQISLDLSQEQKVKERLLRVVAAHGETEASGLIAGANKKPQTFMDGRFGGAVRIPSEQEMSQMSETSRELWSMFLDQQRRCQEERIAIRNDVCSVTELKPRERDMSARQTITSVRASSISLKEHTEFKVPEKVAASIVRRSSKTNVKKTQLSLCTNWSTDVQDGLGEIGGRTEGMHKNVFTPSSDCGTDESSASTIDHLSHFHHPSLGYPLTSPVPPRCCAVRVDRQRHPALFSVPSGFPLCWPPDPKPLFPSSCSSQLSIPPPMSTASTAGGSDTAVSILERVQAKLSARDAGIGDFAEISANYFSSSGGYPEEDLRYESFEDQHPPPHQSNPDYGYVEEAEGLECEEVALVCDDAEPMVREVDESAQSFAGEGAQGLEVGDEEGLTSDFLLSNLSSLL